MSPDEVCELYAKRRIAIKIELLSDGTDDPNPLILVKGTASSLEMLAALFSAVAQDAEGDGFFISPRGAGSKHFDQSSQFGIYIHKSS